MKGHNKNTGIVKLSPELLSIIGHGTEMSLQPFSREIFLLEITVAGTSYCDEVYDVEPLLEEGTILKMLRKPDNEYDELAIAIYYEDIQIGWVPRRMNEVISRLMDAGKAFFCRVVSVEDVDAWVKIKGRIFMVE